VSWTLNDERAGWFAGRLGEEDAAVWRARVGSSDVLGYFIQRTRPKSSQIRRRFGTYIA
jgi:hypothetical protein